MRILLNGLGRIGKAIFRAGFDDINIVAINEKITNLENIAYILKYDTTYGKADFDIEVRKDYLIVNGKKIDIYSKDLNDIDLNSFDLVIEASGKYPKFNKIDTIFTYPNRFVKNIIYGVNDKDIKNYKQISASSCNANALMPVLVALDRFEIVCGDIVTIHPLLSHQKVLDSGCLSEENRGVDCNFEFGRSSVFNLIPSNTTTIEAISLIDKKYKNLITSSSIRTPIDSVGIINLVVLLKNSVTIENILDSLSKNSIIKINDKELVSSDFKGEVYSVVDKRFIRFNKNLLKLQIWYDNELGYAKRVIKIVENIDRRSYGKTYCNDGV